MSIRVWPKQRTVKPLFKTYVECLHIKKTAQSRMLVDTPIEVDGDSRRTEEDVQFDESMVEHLTELSRHLDIYDRLTKSLAPNIWELVDVKRGLLCQLFGGNAFKLPSGINILLVGNPGTSKSQLQCIQKLSPRGIYTSGRGSSAVRLTAYVSKDAETGETVMEQEAVSTAKAGIIASLNARTSVLAFVQILLVHTIILDCP